ncbi:hypothetical protein EYC84_005418 [Monilinia fructicola]|uniref:Uncharacterized protein n=1 Tax=Monilinia fructicola TaxID=38448 RepID=A0A5M9K4V9_MONFR|nr:hypothetical protein EYC84_005418 [Monilinia fructicola]
MVFLPEIKRARCLGMQMSQLAASERGILPALCLFTVGWLADGHGKIDPYTNQNRALLVFIYIMKGCLQFHSLLKSPNSDQMSDSTSMT